MCNLERRFENVDGPEFQGDVARWVPLSDLVMHLPSPPQVNGVIMKVLHAIKVNSKMRVSPKLGEVEVGGGDLGLVQWTTGEILSRLPWAAAKRDRWCLVLGGLLCPHPVCPLNGPESMLPLLFARGV